MKPQLSNSRKRPLRTALIILPACLLFQWMVGEAAAFCSQSALGPSNNCFAKGSPLFQAATTAKIESQSTKVSSTVGSSEPTETPADSTPATTPPPPKATQTVSTTSDSEEENAGVVGKWENLHGNWVLRPTEIPGVDDFDISNSQFVDKNNLVKLTLACCFH